MQCISPLTIRQAGKLVTVPCGKCNFCLAKKRNHWSFRLAQELKTASSGFFLTMTYANEAFTDNSDPKCQRISVDGELQLCKRDVQLFMKRLRLFQKDVSKDPVRYYTVGEYGEKDDRPHYHSIMFNLDPSIAPKLNEIWSHGHVYIGTVEPGSIHYVTKYCINRIGEWGDRAPPFAVMSNKPGIGAGYTITHKKYHQDDLRNYTNVNGIKAALPRYYKERIFEDYDQKHISRESVSDSLEAYQDEIKRLATFHPDPYNHFDERIREAHDSITRKLNDKDKF